MQTQTIAPFIGDDDTLVFTFTSNGSIAGDTFEFVCVLPNTGNPGTLVFRKTTLSGITITDNGSVSTPGVVSVSLVDTLDTVTTTTYRWTLRRTTVGREKVVAFGVLPIGASFKGAA
jgi:hypothetical protein